MIVNETTVSAIVAIATKELETALPAAAAAATSAEHLDSSAQQQQPQCDDEDHDSGSAAPPAAAATVAAATGGGMGASPVQQRLAAEVLRKLQLATEAEEKDDRDVICAEVFADVTGDLNSAARGAVCGVLRAVCCVQPALWDRWAARGAAWRPLSPCRQRDIACHLHAVCACVRAAESTGALYRRWYEVLAPHFCRCWPASEALLALCRRLWGQPFTAPTYALLLHQWLLVHAEAGGREQRLKHINVLCSGG